LLHLDAKRSTILAGFVEPSGGIGAKRTPAGIYVSWDEDFSHKEKQNRRGQSTDPSRFIQPSGGIGAKRTPAGI
jgi:hypothetical protein